MTILSGIEVTDYEIAGILAKSLILPDRYPETRQGMNDFTESLSIFIGNILLDRRSGVSDGDIKRNFMRRSIRLYSGYLAEKSFVMGTKFDRTKIEETLAAEYARMFDAIIELIERHQ